jgi:hypothetical protein
MIQIALLPRLGAAPTVRNLLADTGAGSGRIAFELLLGEEDCVQSGGVPLRFASLGGAYTGSYLVYLIRVGIPALGFENEVPAVGVPNPPTGFDGIACFRFLSRFHYGNFGVSEQFGLETFSAS